MSVKNILVFKHMPSQNPGIFRSFAEKQSVRFIEIDLHAGDEIPDLTLYDGLWVMGGSMNVWEEDKYPWLIEEKKCDKVCSAGIKYAFFGYMLWTPITC